IRSFLFSVQWESSIFIATRTSVIGSTNFIRTDMVNTRSRGETVAAQKANVTTETRSTRGRNAVKKEKTPIKKVDSAISKKVSPTKKSPIKKLVFTASPGRTTYSSRQKTPTRKEKIEKGDDGVERITRNMKRAVLEDSPPSSSKDSAISSSESISNSISPMPSLSDCERDEVMAPPPDDCMAPSPSTLVTPVVPLRGREKEFNQLISLIDASVEKRDPLTVYISGTPGTGKSATTRLVLQLLEQAPRKIKTCMVNCTSVRSGDDMCAAVMRSIDKPCPASTSQSKFKEYVSALKKTFVLVLDEADFVSKDALTSIFTMPVSVSSHLIVVGIANTIDFTERVLRKIKLKKDPVLMVFGRYSKAELTLILSHKMREGKGENTLDDTAVALCAGKVAALSGDIRMAMDLMRQSTRKILREEEEEQKMDVENAAQSNVVSSSSSVAPPSTPIAGRKTCHQLRAINDTFRGVYSSPLARARLPLQPSVLLAVCLKLSAGKKKALTRNQLFSSYQRACNLTGWPMALGEDLEVAFDLIVSQSFIAINGQQIRMQVDSATARSVFDNDVLRRIDDLKL
ncbi:hypothetical protein PFISCL1PPCAC_19392, partial [Pristionchus fissidentatus]